MFKHAYNNDLIDRPMKFGTGFDKPSAALKRRARQAADLDNGKRLFEPSEILCLLQKADIPLRAMILLGINGGMGNTDCARLPIQAVDLDQAGTESDRPKTGVERVVPLWPETIAALRTAIENRPSPADKGAESLVFLTRLGKPWVRESVHRTEDKGIEKVVPVDAIGEEFNKLLKKLGLKRKGRGFYALRHTFRTWADEVRDQHAIHRIMGHAIPGMSGIYVEKIELHRLRAVVDHVRRKLFGEPAPSSSEGPAASPAT
jgi:integrase